MIYRFTKNKDGHKAGDVVDLQPSDWNLHYWCKKRVIEPVIRENHTDVQEPGFLAPEPIYEAPAKVQKKRRKK